MNNIEQAARIAFWGGFGSDNLNKVMPNGCTLKEAIDYYNKNSEILYVLGFIK
jgi:hypothetical protein